MNALKSLERQLESAKRQLAKLESKRYPGDELVEHFHMGLVGGSGRPARALNKKKEKALDRIIDDAKASIKLHERIAELERKIKSFGKAQMRPKTVKRNKKRSTPKPERVMSESYNNWARGLWEDMEARLSAARSQFVVGAWDNLHNQSLRGEMSVYITVQACINCEHLRGKPVTIEYIKQDLLKEQAKAERQLTDQPDKAWLQAHNNALIDTTWEMIALLDEQSVPT